MPDSDDDEGFSLLNSAFSVEERIDLLIKTFT